MGSDEARWLHLEPRPEETLRAALERTLRGAIRSGALREGVRLPASRLLADDLGVSRGVASDAYAQLEAEGFLLIRPREAPLVASIPRLPGAPSRARTPAPTPRFDLTPTTPDLNLFPRRRWLAAALTVHRSLSSTSLGYGESQGEPLLREALADHLGRTRGVIALGPEPGDVRSAERDDERDRGLRDRFITNKGCTPLCTPPCSR